MNSRPGAASVLGRNEGSESGQIQPLPHRRTVGHVKGKDVMQLAFGHAQVEVNDLLLSRLVVVVTRHEVPAELAQLVDGDFFIGQCGPGPLLWSCGTVTTTRAGVEFPDASVAT